MDDAGNSGNSGNSNTSNTNGAPIDPNDWISPGQAARDIKRSEATVLKLALRGKLRSMEFAGRQFISRSSVRDYQAELAADVAAAREKFTDSGTPT